LALAALEKHVRNGDRVADIGTGSGILAIAALRLGAASAVGFDIDEASLAAAKENFELNQLCPSLVAGSADCLSAAYADLTIANINSTVLFSILDDLIRITRPGGWLILTGFPEWEAGVFKGFFAAADISNEQEWRCVTVRI
jgi:ribosomal protein L11 methyltransferase